MLTKEARQAGQQALGIHLSQTPLSQDHKRTPPCRMTLKSVRHALPLVRVYSLPKLNLTVCDCEPLTVLGAWFASHFSDFICLCM